MKIGIDISQIVYGTGVSNYTKELVGNLIKTDKKNEYVLFGSSLRQKEKLFQFVNELKSKNKNVSSRILSFPPTLLNILWNKLHIYPVERFIGKVDIFHCSDWTEPPSFARKVTTVHDLTAFRFPNFLPKKIIKTQKQRLKLAKNEGTHFIAVSESTKKELMHFLEIPEERIFVVYESTGIEFCVIKDRKKLKDVKKKYGLPEKFILGVATREPRKNLRMLVEAYRKLNVSDEIPLILAGKFGWGKDVKEIKGVKLLGYIPQDDLPALYNLATVFVYPSLYEGFGLPILEAMKCGCPVITSNVSSLPEVGGKAVLYVNPLDVEDIAKSIEILLYKDKMRERLRKDGLNQAKKFSWTKSAKQTLRVYKNIAESGSVEKVLRAKVNLP